MVTLRNNSERALSLRVKSGKKVVKVSILPGGSKAVSDIDGGLIMSSAFFTALRKDGSVSVVQGGDAPDNSDPSE